MSCADASYGNEGCGGGLPEFAYLYSDVEPIMSEADYPYTDGITGVTTTTCSYNAALGLVSANGFSFVP